ncbi:MAG TPA: xanthine dehydrogenase accessory protein XdhC [Xanthobacteraceae bacterium]|nr:xanthine dehydrogenase accessory protein XdhC [Xanthobacteraceae bacterium]
MSVPHIKSRHHASRWRGQWLVPLSGHWIDAARTHLRHHAALVRVTVIALRGSAPREAGASMLVDAVGTVGTIGGGRLEWHAVTLARQLLRDARAAPVRIADLILGPELGQCCGGRVELWLERLTRNDVHWLEDAARRLRAEPEVATASEVVDGVVTHRLLRRSFAGAARVEIERGPRERVTLFEVPRPRRPDLWIFGAGHVGQALVRLLAELTLFEITWIDSRGELLPGNLPEGVTPQICADPVELAVCAPAGTRFVVMTHDHALDFELCRVILARAPSSWLGLIGSASKSARFRSRLLRDGLSRETVARLICPIGVPGISSKLPGAIAVAIAAQLLQQQGVAEPGARTVPHAETEPSDCDGGCGSCSSGRQTNT